VYRNEGEYGVKRIAFDKYDVGKVNVETTIVQSQQKKGRGFSDCSGISYPKLGNNTAAPEIRQNKAVDCKVCVNFDT
jgi:hypothetical protein